jgi:hypothetical protein
VRAGRSPSRRSSAHAEREKENQVQFNGYRGAGSRLKAGAWLTPQQQAAAFERALEWRQEWRAEIAGHNPGNGRTAGSISKPPTRKERSRQAAFAEGIARAEFGRFYWDAKRHRLAGTERKPRPVK